MSGRPASREAGALRVHLCRPGFEPECAGEIDAAAARAGAPATARGERGSGLVLADAYPAHVQSDRQPRAADLVFTRQCFAGAGRLTGLPAGDRAGAIVEHALHAFGRAGALVVEHADGPAGRPLARLARRLGPPLEAALRHAGVLVEDPPAPRLHVLLLDGDEALVGVSPPACSSPLPGGVPRLRMPRGAPSRSALKLEEAFATFLDPHARARGLRPGLTAADLGASPGGWTWVLARAGLRVIAVDNGALHEGVRAHPGVTHVRADGFTWRPPRPVDWLTCDIADKPLRVAGLIAEWAAAGRCRSAVFNLKLPMRRRLDVVGECRDLIAGAIEDAGRRHAIRFKHLYHDREEVTGFLRTGRAA